MIYHSIRARKTPESTVFNFTCFVKSKITVKIIKTTTRIIFVFECPPRNLNPGGRLMRHLLRRWTCVKCKTPFRAVSFV